MKAMIAAVALLFSLEATAQQSCAPLLAGQARAVLDHADKTDGVIQFSWSEPDFSNPKQPTMKPMIILMNARAKVDMLDQLSHAGYIAGVPFKITQAGRDALKLPSCP